MTTIKLTNEENNRLNKKVPFTDMNETWKFMKPYFYKVKYGYYEIYSKDEYLKLKIEHDKKE